MSTHPPDAFITFGEQHFWTMVAIVAVTIVLPLVVKKKNSERLTRGVAFSLAFFLLVMKAVEPVYLIANGVAWETELPIHMCDIGAVFAGIMLMNRSYFLYELTYFWGFGGALQALITPSVARGFPYIEYWFFFAAHALIIICAIYATVLFNFRPTVKSVFKAFGAALVLAALVAPVNWLLDTNYMYLCHKPEVASIIDYFGPWPWYLVVLLPVSLALFFIYYSPFCMIDLVKKKKPD